MSASQQFQLDTRRLTTLVVFLAIFAMAARVSLDTDTWWHLRTGEWILENGQVPVEDPFSYTRIGENWRIPGWLVQVPMASMYRAGGPGLLNVWVAGMVTLSFALLWPIARGGVFSRAFIFVLGAAAAGVYWAARPYMASFLFAALYIRILEDWRSGRGGPPVVAARHHAAVGEQPWGFCGRIPDICRLCGRTDSASGRKLDWQPRFG